MDGTTRRQRWWAPKAWMATTRSTSAGSVSTTVWPRLAMPAECTRVSTGPKSSSTAATMASSSARDSTDAW